MVYYIWSLGIGRHHRLMPFRKEVEDWTSSTSFLCSAVSRRTSDLELGCVQIENQRWTIFVINVDAIHSVTRVPIVKRTSRHVQDRLVEILGVPADSLRLF